MSSAEQETLIDGYYKQHRDHLLEENHRLRDRVLFLEGKIRLSARHLEQALAELKP